MKFIQCLFFVLLFCAIAEAANRSLVDNSQIKTLKDPFKKEVIKPKEAVIKEEKIEPKFELSMIFDESAMVNSEWVRNGDEIDGYKVISIKNNSVALQKNDKIKVLRLLFEGGLK